MKIRKGFTLIELLVVVAIIGILSTLAVVALQNARLKSRDARRVSDVKQIQTALELFFAEQNTYPAVPAAAIGSANHDCLTTGGFVADCGTATTFMGSVPADPTNASPYVYTYDADDVGGGACDGTSGDPCTSYSITFELEGRTGDLVSGSHTADKNGLR